MSKNNANKAACNRSLFALKRGLIMDLQEKLSKLQEIVCNSKNIVFFGGAGVSTESGLKDFRSRDGLYNEHYKYPPEEILSHDFFF